MTMTIKRSIIIELSDRDIAELAKVGLEAASCNKFPALQRFDRLDQLEAVVSALPKRDQQKIVNRIFDPKMDMNDIAEIARASRNSSFDEFSTSSAADEQLLKWALTSPGLRRALAKVMALNEKDSAEEDKRIAEEDKKRLEAAIKTVNESGLYNIERVDQSYRQPLKPGQLNVKMSAVLATAAKKKPAIKKRVLTRAMILRPIGLVSVVRLAAEARGCKPKAIYSNALKSGERRIKLWQLGTQGECKIVASLLQDMGAYGVNIVSPTPGSKDRLFSVAMTFDTDAATLMTAKNELIDALKLG